MPWNPMMSAFTRGVENTTTTATAVQLRIRTRFTIKFTPNVDSRKDTTAIETAYKHPTTNPDCRDLYAKLSDATCQAEHPSPFERFSDDN